MTNEDDPERLASGGAGVPPAVARAVAEARALTPPPEALARIATRLEPVFASPLPSAGLSAGAKLAAGATAAVLAGAAAWFALTGDPAPPAPAISRPASEEREPASREPAQGATLAEPSTPSAAAPDAVPVAPADPPPSARAPAEKPAAAASEVGLLQRAQAALRADPGRALALTAEHERRFPRGALVQEREVIRIEALRRLGKTSAAQERASKFERDFPDSAHRRKVGETPRAP